VQRAISILMTIIFLLALLSFTVTYSVRFTEKAVLTTFGKPAEQPVEDEGLKFKWPYPVQAVTKYDTRSRVLQSRAEAQQTRDDRQIIMESFLVWRVSNPLEFFRTFSNAGARPEDHYRKAEQSLNNLLRSAMAETGKYRLDELFTPDAGASKLAELEARILASLGSPDERGKSLKDYGIEAELVGINRIRLAESTTQAVNERMAANRDRLAKEIESEGEAVAEAIRSQAESDRQRILDFARARAREIQAQGDIEAGQYLAQMNENPELAVFLREIDLLKQTWSKRVTLVLTTGTPGLSLLAPDALSGLTPGQIPPSRLPPEWLAAGGSGRTAEAPPTTGSPGADPSPEPSSEQPR